MADSFKIDFQAHGKVEAGDLVVFVGEDLKPTPAVAKQLGAKAVDLIAKAAAAENFKGKAKSAMSIVRPAGLSGRPADRGRHRRRKGPGKHRISPSSAA